jgi:HlyD family secretion protein
MLLGPAIVVDQVSRGTLIKSIVASGHVETPFRVDIGSQITGAVEEVLVQEGQHVRQGQPLIKLEDSELRAAVVQAEGALAQAQARLRQLEELTLPTAREALAQAKATLLDAQLTYDRTAALAQNGHATKAALDDARRNLDIAHTQVRSAELQVFTNSAGGSDYVVAQSQLRQAEANLATARARLGYATISAPRSGVLITRNVERGAIVQPGKALLSLAPEGVIQLVVEIDEKNLGLLRLGQSALASADAYPDQTFKAEISYINPGVDITRASVEVKLDVPGPPAFLVQDMTVSVDIDVAHKDDAVIVPRRDVYDALGGMPWLMIVHNGRTFKRPVQLGIVGTTYVEIRAGAVPGEEVVPQTARMLTGQRLRPVPSRETP